MEVMTPMEVMSSPRDGDATRAYGRWHSSVGEKAVDLTSKEKPAGFSHSRVLSQRGFEVSRFRGLKLGGAFSSCVDTGVDRSNTGQHSWCCLATALVASVGFHLQPGRGPTMAGAVNVREFLVR